MEEKMPFLSSIENRSRFPAPLPGEEANAVGCWHHDRDQMRYMPEYRTLGVHKAGTKLPKRTSQSWSYSVADVASWLTLQFIVTVSQLLMSQTLSTLQVPHLLITTLSPPLVGATNQSSCVRGCYHEDPNVFLHVPWRILLDYTANIMSVFVVGIIGKLSSLTIAVLSQSAPMTRRRLQHYQQSRQHPFESLMMVTAVLTCILFSTNSLCGIRHSMKSVVLHCLNYFIGCNHLRLKLLMRSHH